MTRDGKVEVLMECTYSTNDDDRRVRDLFLCYDERTTEQRSRRFGFILRHHTPLAY